MVPWRMRGAVTAAAALVLLAGCRAGPGGQSAREMITVKGSDTMVVLGQRWSEQYMNDYPSVVIQVTGGGSGTGIAALINGTTHVAQASRPMTGEERSQVRERLGHPVREFPVAWDGVAIYLHPDNPVRELTMADLRRIYAGEVTSWQEFGGPDRPIILYGRENNSGTYAFFKEHVLAGGDFAATTQTLSGTAAVVNAVASDLDGIGYGGIAYASGVRIAGVAASAGAPPTSPTLETVRDGSYPLARPLYWYVVDRPSPALEALIQWVLSPTGQEVVSNVGYFPLQ